MQQKQIRVKSAITVAVLNIWHTFLTTRELWDRREELSTKTIGILQTI